MSEEKAKENSNPLADLTNILKDIVRATQGVFFEKAEGIGKGIPCGAHSRDSNDNQHLLMAAREGR